MQIEVQCSKNYFKIFLPQEAEASGNKIEKEWQNPCLKLKILNFYRACLLCLQPVQVVVFCKHVLIF